MSEYQYYEFLAIDRPLNEGEQAAVRSLSTRARISSTSFVNEYHWGDFKGDPRRLMERYYDAHLYVANWGTHRVMFRLPCELLDPDVVEDYCIAWSRVEAMIATRKPAEYDAAVTLLSDLQALAERDGHYDTFTLRTIALRQTHARKPSLIKRLNRSRI